MNYSEMDSNSLKIHHGHVMNLCMFLELVIRRGLETPALSALYDKAKAELQKIESVFYADEEKALKSKQDLLNNALKIYLAYVRHVYDPGNEYNCTCDYNHPQPGYKTISLQVEKDCDPEQLIEKMNRIDELYAELDNAMEDFSGSLPDVK